MNPKALAFAALTACLSLYLVSTASAQRSQPEVRTSKVAGNVYMLQVRGGNIGVSVGEDGILIVDDDYPNASEAIDAALGKLSKGSLKFVLNTHYHGDHTGGNRFFGAEAPIVAHDNVRVRLEKGKDLSDPAVRAGLPSITFEDSASLHFNGEQILLKHLATGHTDGDSVVYFTESKVLHMGDHYFAHRFPFIDLAGGGDVESYLDNVRSVIKEKQGVDGLKVIPGHGPLSNISELKAWEKSLTEAVGIIQSGIDAGKSRDDLLEAGLPDKFVEFGGGFVNEKRFIGIVHQSLTQ